MRRTMCFAVFVVGWLLTCQGTARADPIVVNVDPNSGPWEYDAVLNSLFEYGDGSHSPPAVVDGSSGILFIAGETLTITAPNFPLVCPFGAFCDDGNFDDTEFQTVAGNIGSLLKNDSTAGASGQPFPSFYMDFDPGVDDIFIMALVGTFADATGAIVGTPFEIGLGGDFVIPAGATQLLMGFNDDVFQDNHVGQLIGPTQGEIFPDGTIPVTVSGPMAVPEPSTLLLLGTGLVGVGLGRRRRTQ